MKKITNVLLMVMVGIAICAIPMVAQAATEDEVVALVEKGVALLNEQGDAGLAIIGKPDGEFVNGPLYAFVYDENVVMLAHPVKPTLVGKSYKGKPDVRGNKFRDGIVAKAMSGGGWTEYVYQKPGESGLHKKKAYSKLAEKDGKKYIVAAGMYAD